MFDAAFFTSSLMPIWREMAAVQLKVGSDQGLDLLWCGVAARTSGRVPCAVIGTPIEHRNLKTIHKKIRTPEGRRFQNASLIMREYAGERWPQLFFGAELRDAYKATSQMYSPYNRVRLQCLARQAGVDSSNLPCVR